MSLKEEKNRIKQSLTIEQVFDLCADLGGEPQMYGNHFVSKTICHNPIGEGSPKLFYYENTQLFKCYTACGDTSFDIFDLVTKVKLQSGEMRPSHDDEGHTIYRNWSLYDSILYVAKYFNISVNLNEPQGFDGLYMALEDWDVLKRYQPQEPKQQKRIELKYYDKDVLRHFPQPHIIPWEKEGITYAVAKECGIAYNPCSQGVVIPHFDKDNNLIGIRERTLIKAEEDYGKYRPSIINRQQYNHPLGFSLYNLNNSKDNIKIMKKAVVYESEKSTLLHRSYFGGNGDISVAVCGSSFTQYQCSLLLDLGVEEIIICFDKQFRQLGDEEFQRWTKKLAAINEKYKRNVLISFAFDKWNLLGYKDSPIDCGKETFLELFNNRIIL